MRICNRTIIFEESDEDWQKEHHGGRYNTAQYLDAYEWDSVKGRGIKDIMIVNEGTHQTFTREISDISIPSIKTVPVWVFSWHPDSDV